MIKGKASLNGQKLKLHLKKVYLFGKLVGVRLETCLPFLEATTRFTLCHKTQLVSGEKSNLLAKSICKKLANGRIID